MILKLMATAACGVGKRRKLLVLTYHRVLEQRDEFIGDIAVDSFEKHVEVLSQNFKVMRLDDAAKRLSNRRLPARAVCITFDDGYADNYDVAFPILKKYDVPATFFVATGYLDGGIMWNDVIRHACQISSDESFLEYQQRRGGLSAESTQQARIDLMHEMINMLKYRGTTERNEQAKSFSSRLAVVPSDSLMMSSSQVSQLARSRMEIGAHTVNHPILSSVSLQEARREIDEGRARLEEITGDKVSSFAFPNGRPGVDFDQSHLELLRELEFRSAVTTKFACARYDNEPLELPRLGVWGATRLRIFFRLIDHYVRH